MSSPSKISKAKKGLVNGSEIPDSSRLSPEPHSSVDITSKNDISSETIVNFPTVQIPLYNETLDNSYCASPSSLSSQSQCQQNLSSGVRQPLNHNAIPLYAASYLYNSGSGYPPQFYAPLNIVMNPAQHYSPNNHRPSTMIDSQYWSSAQSVGSPNSDYYSYYRHFSPAIVHNGYDANGNAIMTPQSYSLNFNQCPTQSNKPEPAITTNDYLSVNGHDSLDKCESLSSDDQTNGPQMSQPQYVSIPPQPPCIYPTGPYIPIGSTPLSSVHSSSNATPIVEVNTTTGLKTSSDYNLMNNSIVPFFNRPLMMLNNQAYKYPVNRMLISPIQNEDVSTISSTQLLTGSMNNLTISSTPVRPYPIFVSNTYSMLSPKITIPSEIRTTSGTQSPISRQSFRNSAGEPLYVDHKIKERLKVNQINELKDLTFQNSKFFVIKSRSKENVIQAILHQVWCSTFNGNDILDAAYRRTHQTSCPIYNNGLVTIEKSDKNTEPVEISLSDVRRHSKQSCESVNGHVYLFFSVNGSRCFCGVAEMIGPVNKNRSVSIWQDGRKWKDSFPIRWIYIKNVSNTLCNHIVLQEHDNRPITFLRDAAEITSKDKAIQLFKIFQSHP